MAIESLSHQQQFSAFLETLASAKEITAIQREFLKTIFHEVFGTDGPVVEFSERVCTVLDQTKFSSQDEYQRVMGKVYEKAQELLPKDRQCDYASAVILANRCKILGGEFSIQVGQKTYLCWEDKKGFFGIQEKSERGKGWSTYLAIYQDRLEINGIQVGLFSYASGYGRALKALEKVVALVPANKDS